MADSEAKGIDLAEVLRDVRGEITRATDAARGEDLRFAVTTVRVELSVMVERSKTGKGGVKFWVVEAGAEAGVKRASTHTLAFELQPQSVTTGTSPLVSGRALPGER